MVRILGDQRWWNKCRMIHNTSNNWQVNKNEWLSFVSAINFLCWNKWLDIFIPADTFIYKKNFIILRERLLILFLTFLWLGRFSVKFKLKTNFCWNKLSLWWFYVHQTHIKFYKICVICFSWARSESSFHSF